MRSPSAIRISIVCVLTGLTYAACSDSGTYMDGSNVAAGGSAAAPSAGGGAAGTGAAAGSGTTGVAGSAAGPSAGAAAGAAGTGAGAAGAAGTGAGAAGSTATPGGGAAGTSAGAAGSAAGAAGTAAAAGAAAAAGSGATAGASAGAAGSAAGAAGSGSTTTAATFSQVYEEVFIGGSCATPLCHQNAESSMLALIEAGPAYTSLVGVNAAGPDCATSNTPRVKAGDPAGSLLMQKLEGTQTCGASMPPGDMLEPELLDKVRSWIMAGAKND